MSRYERSIIRVRVYFRIIESEVNTCVTAIDRATRLSLDIYTGGIRYFRDERNKDRDKIIAREAYTCEFRRVTLTP